VNSQPARRDVPSVRAVLRVIVTVALSGLALYLMYLVREPLSWLLIAMFVAVAASGPVTLGAVIVGVVTLFSDFPTTRIIGRSSRSPTSSSRTTSCSRASRAGRCRSTRSSS
jgi:hypothetical protein